MRDGTPNGRKGPRPRSSRKSTAHQSFQPPSPDCSRAAIKSITAQVRDAVAIAAASDINYTFKGEIKNMSCNLQAKAN